LFSGVVLRKHLLFESWFDCGHLQHFVALGKSSGTGKTGKSPAPQSPREPLNSLYSLRDLGSGRQFRNHFLARYKSPQ
jgi:hypothetical protein